MQQHFDIADLQQVVASCVGVTDVGVISVETLDESFADLGVDSLARYEVATRLQDTLTVTISDDDIERATTPRLMLALVNERLSGLAQQGSGT
ncbi:acyl carrier protein [Dactylosporangium vinaceum]|uniref:Acyl carrier protein n=1 Tax=Dactylosporangium vinaceum TaxID=53362 RepID=A0ABV5M3C2_9ACTN|nr:acyl carrier protein [Dactylosporangium vinaceum]UAB99753.1 acyl carrier protein [Dactylosporangium vinaceum]